MKGRVLRAAALALALASPAPGKAGSPEVDYMLECRGCHGPDGSGQPGAVPDLRGSVGRFLGVPGGRAYLVRVPGSAQSPLDDAALAAVLNWMIGRFDPASAARRFPPYDAEEVARYRRDPLLDVSGTRAALLRRLGELP